MPCSRSFTLSPAEVPLPLDDATVIADTIFATMGPYVMKFNGSTGALIASARVCAPMVGPCRITQLGGTIYVSTWNNRAMDLFPAAYPADWFFNKAIWPVNPTTLTIGTPIELAQLVDLAGCGWSEWSANIQTIRGIGSYLYIFYGTSNASNMIRVNPSTLAYSHFCVYDNTGLNPSLVESVDDDGSWIYMGDPDNTGVVRIELATLTDVGPATNDDFINTGTNQVRAVASPAPNTAYGVCGTATLVKTVFPSPGTSTTFNLALIQAGVRPFRIRYNPNDGLIYIACQNQDCVIIWNPTLDTGILKSGFASPIDVCFTASGKKWAVQNSGAGLQEIV